MDRAGWIRSGVLVRIWALLMLGSLVLPGCREQAPPLSPRAAALVIVVQDALAGLAADLAEPLAASDFTEIDVILQDYFSGAATGGGLPLKRLGVTDQLGATISDYPSPRQVRGQDFSHFAAVAQALQNHRISHERLFVPDLPDLFFLCAPVTHQGQVLGAVWFALEAEKVQARWGVGPEDFLRLDFNK